MIHALIRRLLQRLQPAPAWPDTWPVFTPKQRPLRVWRGQVLPWPDTRPMPSRRELAAEVKRWPHVLAFGPDRPREFADTRPAIRQH